MSSTVAATAPVALDLAGLIASMADDEFVIGFSDSEWTGIAPLLEEDVAMSSIAQDELGHAAALFGRRQESVRLWIVRREDIVDLHDPDLLQPPLDRSFKKPGGYVMRDKLAAARAAAGQEKPKARSR